MPCATTPRFKSGLSSDRSRTYIKNQCIICCSGIACSMRVNLKLQSISSSTRNRYAQSSLRRISASSYKILLSTETLSNRMLLNFSTVAQDRWCYPACRAASWYPFLPAGRFHPLASAEDDINSSLERTAFQFRY